MSKNLFEDLQEMAARIIKDPAARKALEAQFKTFSLNKDISGHGDHKSPEQILDEIYEQLKEQLKHVNSPSDLGDTENEQSSKESK